MELQKLSNGNHHHDDAVPAEGGIPAEEEMFLPHKSDGSKRPQFTDFEGKTSFGMSVFNLSNAIMGSGILGLSYAMSNTGIVLFLILLTCIAALSCYSVHLLLRSAGVVGIRAYEQLGMRAFGHPGKIVAAVVITLHNIGAMSSYLFIVKSELPLVIQAFLGQTSSSDDWFMNGNYLIIIVTLGLILPLALMKHLGYLGYTSGFSLSCMVFFLSAVIYKKFNIACPLEVFGNYSVTTDVSEDTCAVKYLTVNQETAYTIPILAFAFVCHPEVLPIYTELSNPTKRRMQNIGNVSILGMFVMYFLTATFGYLTFYGNTEAELLHTYSKVDPLDTLILCVRLAVLVAVTLTVPVVLFPKCDGVFPVEFRSFAVDPQITSLEVLQHILIRAFDLNGKRNFGISYLSRDRSGAETYLSLLSDWDLDVAFVGAAKSHLQLKMDIKPSEDSPVMEEWDIISPKDVIGSEQLLAERTRSLASAALPFTQSLLSQVGRTLNKVQQALSWSYGEEIKPFKPPLSDAEFHNYLNGQGQLSRPEELRLRIYHGGVEPSLRKVVWRYLLNVYPDGLSGQERMDYMKRKTREYDQLKREWTARVSHEDLEFIRGNVLKDVLRTDRAHPYYAGSEDSPHLTALTDLLTAFAITHPQISYCQGMSDIASPILAVMDNEAHAFICFCGIMKRLEGNFRPDGQLMSVKFQHLKLLLQYSDPEFYSYLVSRGADDLFFCYRWLLLELKREFAFDDALRMLEVTWSSLPPDPPETEVELLGPPVDTDEATSCREKDKTVENGLGDDKEQKENQRRRHMMRPSREEPDVSRNVAMEKTERRNVGAEKESEAGECDIPQATVENTDWQAPPLERQTSFGEFKYYSARNEDSFHMEDAELPQRLVSSKSATSIARRQSTVDSEDDPGEKTPLIKNGDNGFAPISSPPLFPSGLPIWKTGPSVSPTSSASPSSWPGASPDSPPKSPSPSTTSGSEALLRTVPKVLTNSAQVLSSTGINSPTTPTVKTSVASPNHALSRSLLASPILSFGRGPSLSGGKSSYNSLPSPGNKSPSTTANTPSSSKAETTSIKPCSLPPPQEFGKGNPFMLFLCLSILLEHRDHIIKNSLDYNELAMHFDRLVRRHNLSRVLQRAKALFADYLQSEVWDSEEGDEVSSDSPTTATAAQHSPSSTSSARPIYSPLASPQSSSPNSTYNLATTIPSPTAQVSLSPVS